MQKPLIFLGGLLLLFAAKYLFFPSTTHAPGPISEMELTHKRTSNCMPLGKFIAENPHASPEEIEKIETSNQK